jgi:DNA-binding LytR/AlgR family response regulator
MQKLRIGIVEDDFLIAESIVETLTQIGYEAIEPVRTFYAAIEMIETQSPDLVLLDIEIDGDKSGIDVGLKINDTYKLPFIFLTAFSDNATLEKAKKANPYAYLVKPFNEGDLFTAIEIAFNHYDTTKPLTPKENNSSYFKNIIFIKQGDLFHKIEIDSILYVESDNVYLNIYTLPNKHFVVRNKLEDFINEFPTNDLVRVHRSYAINLKHLDAIDAAHVKIQDKVIPLGKNYKDELMEKIKTLR